MRYIEKHGAPDCLTDWIAWRQREGLITTYREFNEGTKLRGELLREQFGLCAYTGKEVALTETSVEHIKPQRKCEIEALQLGLSLGDDLNYWNMVATWRLKTHIYDSNKNRLPVRDEDLFGEVVRERMSSPGLYDPSNFVSPLDPICKESFSYTLTGEIVANSPAAKETIRQLRLDHKTLVELRNSVISAVFDRIANDALPHDLLIEFTEPNNSVLSTFSFVVAQILRRDILQLEP